MLDCCCQIGQKILAHKVHLLMVYLLYYSWQYSDLAETERARILESFRHATIKWNQNAVQSRDGNEVEEELSKSSMIVVTDSCVPIASVESPLQARVLINYELPVKKLLKHMEQRGIALMAPGETIY
ncbi:DNA-directed RNA polymerase III subunit RPC5 [Bienertia sinuspersici]